MKADNDFNYPFLQYNAFLGNFDYDSTKKDDDEQLRHHAIVMYLINLYNSLKLLDFSDKDLKLISEELFAEILSSIKLYLHSNYYQDEVEALKNLYLFENQNFGEYFSSYVKKAIHERICWDLTECRCIVTLDYVIDELVSSKERSRWYCANSK